jgi:hypothetical protein
MRRETGSVGRCRAKAKRDWNRNPAARCASRVENEIVALGRFLENPPYLTQTRWSEQGIRPQAAEILPAALESCDHGGIGDRDQPV